MLLAAQAVTAKVDGGSTDKMDKCKLRRAPKPWWRASSREQAVSWGAAAAVAVFVAVFFGLYFSRPAGPTGFIPLQRFSSNLGGKSGFFVFVSMASGSASGRRLQADAAATGSFRVTSAAATSLADGAASEAVTLIDKTTGASMAFDGDALVVERRGNTLVLASRVYGRKISITETVGSASVDYNTASTVADVMGAHCRGAAWGAAVRLAHSLPTPLAHNSPFSPCMHHQATSI